MAFATVLLLPYDVANSRGSGGGIRVDVLYQIMMMFTAVMISFVIPYAFFFYESDVDPRRKVTNCLYTQTGKAFLYTIGFFIIFFIILICMFTQLATAEVPVTRVAQNANLMVDEAEAFPNIEDKAYCLYACVESVFNWELDVSFPIYVIAFLSFIGWFFFTLFVGVGLMSVPLDLVNEYRTRPAPMGRAQYEQEKKQLGERTAMLIEIGKKIQKDQQMTVAMSFFEKRELKANTHKFETYYYFLKQDLDILKTAYVEKGGNPLVPMCKLLSGVIAGVLSLCWVIHIAIFVFPERPSANFLNSVFIDLEFGGSFPLFGVLAYSLFVFYLMFCCVQGNFKIGIRMFCFKIYPMELGKTLMNAFLANTWIILLCSVPTLQFASTAFPVYARFTDLDLIFGTQVFYLKFLSYFWKNNVFIVAMLTISFLTMVWLIIQPTDKNAQIEAKLDLMAMARDKELEARGEKVAKKAKK